jgi:hypothetical protein
MNKTHHISFSLLFCLTIFGAGCDLSDNKTPNKVERQDASIEPRTTTESPAEQPINLSLPPQTSEQLSSQENDFLAPAESPTTSPLKPQKQDDVRLEGKLHFDDEEEDYLESVEGAEINIEVKFE